MKKILLMLALVAALATTAACSSTPSTETESGNDSAGQATTEQTQTTAENDSSAPSDNGTLGDYTVAIKDCTIAKNYEDKDCVVVTFDFTNNSDTNQSFESALSAQAFQNGVQIDTTTGVYENSDSYDDITDSSLTNLQPGATTEVKKAFVLSDMSPVDVEVTEWINLSNDKLAKTFTLE